MRGRFIEASAFADRAGSGFIVLKAFVAALLVEFGFDGGFEFAFLAETFPDLAESPAMVAPAVRGVEGEQARVEWFECAAARRAIHLGAQDGRFALCVFHAGGAFAHAESLADEFVGFFCVRGREFPDEGVDRVFLEAFELFETLHRSRFAVHDESGDALTGGGAGDIRVEAFAALDEVGKNFDWSLGGVAIHFRSDGGRCAVFHSDIARRAELGAEFGKEEAQEVVDLGDGGYGGFSAAASDALFDGHAWREAFDRVHIRLLKLIDELAGIGGHAVEEAALAFGEEDVEGERGFARAAEAGHNDHAVARDIDIDIF